MAKIIVLKNEPKTIPCIKKWENNSHPLTVADKTFQEVRQAGASDADIVEALGVMELFTAFNKFLDSLQVELD